MTTTLGYYWTYRRKAKLLSDIAAGLTTAEANDLSPEELAEWKVRLKLNGPEGLRVSPRHNPPTGKVSSKVIARLIRRK